MRIPPEDPIVKNARDLASRLLENVEVAVDELEASETIGTDDRYDGALRAVSAAGMTRLSVVPEKGGVGATLDHSFAVSEIVSARAAGFAGRILREDLIANSLSHHGGQEGRGHVRAVVVDSDNRIAWVWIPTVTPRGFVLGDLTVDVQVAGGTVVPPPKGQEPIRLSGLKVPLVPNALSCTHLLVGLGGGEPDTASFYLLPANTEGVRITGGPVPSGLRAHGMADVLFDGVTLSPELRIVDGADGAGLARRVLALINTGAAYRTAGLLQAAHRIAQNYAHDRVQGGRPIAQHSAVAHALTRAEAATQAIRGAAEEAAECFASGEEPDLRLAVAARHHAVQQALPMTLLMSQVLGGYGVSNEYPTAKLYRDAVTLSLRRGTLSGAGFVADMEI